MKIWLSTLVLLAGCDRVFGLNRTPVDAPDDTGGTIDAPLTCPSNYLPRSGGGFYRISGTAMSWHNARADCRRDKIEITGHTHLVVAASSQEMRDIVIGDQIWIGLTDVELEGQWAWITTEEALPATVFPPDMGPPWSDTEPNNSGGNEHCAVLKSNGELNDFFCGVSNLLFICECDYYPERP